MEFLDEDARPRFLLQSRPQSYSLDTAHQKPSKFSLFFSISISFSLFLLSFFFLQTEPFQSLLFWLSLSILVGPFAPSHLTGGHIRVGHGPILENPVQDHQIELDTKRKPHKNRSYASPVPTDGNSNGVSGLSSKDEKNEVKEPKEDPVIKNGEEKEWNEEDIEILKKQMVKNPVGKPKRWEVIAEAFNGRHRVESVIKIAKELGEKKMDDSDSYAQFLKNRKSLDARIQGTNEEGAVIENRESGGGGGGRWSAAEDIALLNALKVFPKDVAMRWEKIAAAVPGRSKAACIKRVADLKRDFRTSKAGAET